MKKKEYIKPEVCIIEMETSNVLAGSTSIGNASDEEDYTEENVKKIWDDPLKKGIWGD